jgi:hypothetical protein
LENALRKEKMFGVSTNKKSTNYTAFKGYYILVEEPSGAYKPVIAAEYPKDSDLNDPPWPVMRFGNHSSVSVFAPPSENSCGKSENSSSDARMYSLALQNSNASGINSAVTGSVASTTSRGVAALDSHNSLALSYRTLTPIAPTNKKTRELSTAEAKVSSIREKPGFCENCNVKYSKYIEVR